MALTKCAKCKREWQANSGVEPCPWCRASAAESSLADMRQRAEEAEARAERAEKALREYTHFEASLIADRGSWSGATGHPFRTDKLLDQFMECQRLRNAALSSPPADASAMGGEKERLITAFLAGFEASAEGWNGEYPECGAKDRRVKEDAEEYARAALAEMEQKS